MYICAIREMDVYLYIGMRGNFEKNFLFTLTRSGYMESASSGLLAGRNAVRRLEGKAPLILPITTMMGSLAEHAAHSPSKDFKPMGANFGILPVIEPHIRDKKERYAALSARALEDLAETLKNA